MSLLTACRSPEAPAADPESQDGHVVIMLIDTLRADRLGIYGYGADTSPNIDRLAGEAAVFERVHSSAPWTLPSVVSLMLSAPLCEHNVVQDRQRIGDSARPLALRLQEVGYATGAYYQNPYAGEVSGLDRGFDVSELVKRKFDDGEAIREWLARTKGQPSFLYLHSIEPHQPFSAKAEHLEALGHEVPNRESLLEMRRLVQAYRKLTRIDFVRRQPLGTEDNSDEQRKAMERLNARREEYSRLYDAQVRAADERVGRVVEALKQEGVWDETLFVLVADHGEEMNEHGGWLHDQSAYEELIRVPLLIKFPRGKYSGRRISTQISLLDVLPTVVEVLGRPALAEESRGKSLLALLDTTSTEVPVLWGEGPRVTSMRHNQKKYYRPFKDGRGDLNLVVVDGPWKGIYNPEVSSFELYHLDSDPAEGRNLSAQEPRRTRLMRKVARGEYRQCLSRQGNSQDSAGGLDPEQEQALRSLGYIGDGK
jgi:arylsulfatase A-like enzyme